jgi:antitoxin (DNA-binding transcriptional repressor) of toxin-antitoxin stability system
MNQATVRDLRYDFPAVLSQIEHGQEIAITKRGKIVARLLPPAKSPKKKKIKWPDFAARAKAISGGRPPGNFVEWYCENRE